MMSTDVVGSKMPARNGYGENGFDGPSSVMPPVTPPLVPKDAGIRGPQTRRVSDEPLPPAHGMRKP
jgi:hypothetical protein